MGCPLARPRSCAHPPALDEEGLSGYVARVIADQKHCGTADVELWVAGCPPQRQCCRLLLDASGMLLGEGFPTRRARERAQGVDIDPVRTPLTGRDTGQGSDGFL